jgi:hypothetical protein
VAELEAGLISERSKAALPGLWQREVLRDPSQRGPTRLVARYGSSPCPNYTKIDGSRLLRSNSDEGCVCEGLLHGFAGAESIGLTAGVSSANR